ncbi:hypothetical protein, partial [Bradyrhizobium sp.]|uniref:hypothetical protein n=1 Tax=Bradyrhizobium sp. TaxID=376 RepID=UPI00391C04CB
MRRRQCLKIAGELVGALRLEFRDGLMGQLAIIAVLVRYRGHQLQIRVQSHHRRCVRQLRDVRHLVIEVFDVSAKPRSRRPRLVDRGDDQI